VPELPEVETIRADLSPLVSGRTIQAVEVDPGTAHLLLGGIATEDFAAALRGRRIEDLGRRGKYLLFALDDGRVFVAHLRMTGRLVWRDSEAPAEPFERARIILDAGHDLRWSDIRKFGTWRLVNHVSEAIGSLGPEPIDDDFSLKRFRAALARRTAPIKSVLLDQRRMAGIGNIYADEALFQARVRPDTPAGDLSPAATRRLHDAVRSVLERGIANRGASFRDYVDGEGNAGQQQMYVQVFRRTGQPCYRCGSIVRRTVIGGRATHFCPRCQPRPRKSAVRSEQSSATHNDQRTTNNA
jgi:formamidopyrimidine-DNA glycosylase